MKTIAVILLPLVLQSYEESVAKLADDLTKADTAPAKVGVGDEYVKLLKKFPKKRAELVDAAGDVYGQAWPDLDPVWKMKMRDRLERLYAPTVPGKASKARPVGWGGIVPAGCEVELSNRKAHSGGTALVMSAKKPGLTFVLQTPTIAVQPKQKVQVSVWVLSDGTKGTGESASFVMSDANSGGVWTYSEGIREDFPFWKRIASEVEAPEKAFSLRLDLWCKSDVGCLWIDDISIKVDGKEMMQNGGFEK